MSKFEFYQENIFQETPAQTKEREIDGKIKDLLSQGMSLEKMAEILGMEAEDYIETIGRRSKQKGAVVRFDASGFRKKIVANLACNEIALPDEYIYSDKTIIPPDLQEIKKNDGDGEWREKEVIPRTRYVMELLSEMKKRYRVYDGENAPGMIRDLSYKGFEVEMGEGVKKMILVCNESENATFIIHNIEEAVEEYFKKTKNQLGELHDNGLVSRVEYRFKDGAEYKKFLMIKLLSDGERRMISKGNGNNTSESRQDLWERMFSRYKNFYESYGHGNIPLKYDIDQKLSNWVRTQKKYYKQGKLSEDKVGRLALFDFDFEDKVRSWEDKFLELKKYYSDNAGNEIKLKRISDRKIGKFASKLRSSYREGKLTEEQINRLQEIGFHFDEVTAHEDWDDMYNKLSAYYKEHGQLKVSRQKNSKLSMWVTRQRQYYEQKELSQEKIKKLSDIGFNFKKKSFEGWEEKFKKLEEHYKKYGDIEISDESIMHWKIKQRSNYSKGKLSAERVRLLKNIGFDFEQRTIESWDKMFDKVEKYYLENKNCKIPLDYEDKKLLEWIRKQRSYFKDDSYKNQFRERYERLLRIDFFNV